MGGLFSRRSQDDDARTHKNSHSDFYSTNEQTLYAAAFRGDLAQVEELLANPAVRPEAFKHPRVRQNQLHTYVWPCLSMSVGSSLMAWDIHEPRECYDVTPPS